jgi:hypothetical protein
MATLSAGLLTLASFANLSSCSLSSKGSEWRWRSKLGLHSLAVSLLVLGATLPSLANTYAVTNTNDNGPGSLRSALSSAANGDTINIHVTGTITLTSAELVIGANVTINGPGAANLAISGNGQFTVFQVNSEVTAATISRVTIEDGYASQTAGGGINNQGTLTLRHSTVTDNIDSADGASGEAINNQGTLTLRHSTVSDNISSNDGAGIYNSGTLIVSFSTLSGNGGGLPGASGGGIYNTGTGTLTVRHSKVSGNSVHDGGQGAGIYNGGTLTVSNSTLSDNVDSFGPGGGIYNNGSKATVSDSTLSGNSAVEDSGGGIYNGGTLTVSNSTLSGNSSTDGNEGGAIFNFGTLTVSNSTLSGNSATDGGQGGAIFNDGTLTLKSTLLASQVSGGNCDGVGRSLSDGYNLSDDSTCAFLTQTGDQNNSTTVGLSPSGLQNNGGRTQTIALLSTSSAVDAIPLAACTDAVGDSVSNDQRGVARPQGSGCDIGAYELVPFVSPVSLNFGNVKLCRSKKEVVTLTNTGETKLQIDAISFIDVSGNPADFIFHRHCGPGLLPGHSCTFAVRFSPSEVARETATLNIVTSAPGSPLQVPITATGIP